MIDRGEQKAKKNVNNLYDDWLMCGRLYGLRRFGINSNPHGKNDIRSHRFFSKRCAPNLLSDIRCVMLSAGRCVPYRQVNTLLVLLNVCVYNQSRCWTMTITTKVTTTTTTTTTRKNRVTTTIIHITHIFSKGTSTSYTISFNSNSSGHFFMITGLNSIDIL